jgi:hypothetical protein
MPGENIQDWSTVAASNSSADSAINWAEGQPRASVNNSSRSMMAAHAKDRNLKNGSIVTTGSANAQAFLSGLSYSSVPTGLRATLKIGATLTNTGPATLSMDGIAGAQIIDNRTGLFLVSGELRAGGYAEFLYDGTNWILIANQVDRGLTNMRVFTASGTYPTSTATTKVLVYAKGAGGGGGSATVAGPRGGGGGEGAETWLLTTAAALSGLAVTIGAGGLNGIDGATGGATSVGTICTAPGGIGGTRGDFGGAGGQGGGPGVGTFSMPGMVGQFGSDSGGTLAFNAAGGGKGGGGAQTNGTANSGGGGGNGSSVATAGIGGSGIVVCYEHGTI